MTLTERELCDYYINGDDYYALYHTPPTAPDDNEGHFVCHIEEGTPLSEIIQEATRHECP